MKKSIVFAVVLTSGCATGLNSMQHQELLGYEAKGMAIEEKSTATATALGILPGGGSFYTRNYGFGAVNLLLWPFSVLWDPISGYNGAEELNYHATVTNANKLKEAEISNLDSLLMTQQINNAQYILKKREAEQKYSPTGSVANSSLLPMPINKPVVNETESYKVPVTSSSPVTNLIPKEPVSNYENNTNIPSSRSKGDLRDCLKLQTNEEMIRCAEKGR